MRWGEKLKYYLKGGLNILWTDILFLGAVFLVIYAGYIIYTYFLS